MSEELEQELLWVINHEEVVSTPLKREEIIEIYKEIERLNKELEIYKLRHKLALKKLNSAMKHYDLEDKNNTIKFCKEILEGQGIEEKCHKMLRGDKE